MPLPKGSPSPNPKGRPSKIWPIEELRHMIEVEGKKHREVELALGLPSKYAYTLCKKHGIKSQRRGPRGGPDHPDWTGGRILDGFGYWLVYTPGHPYAKKPVPYVREHRLVMEKHLGRYLDPKEVVHHINGDSQDNRIENLQLFSKNSDHLKHELKGRVPNWTEDGKRRMVAGSPKHTANPFGLKRDDYPLQGNSTHPTSAPDTEEQRAS